MNVLDMLLEQSSDMQTQLNDVVNELTPPHALGFEERLSTLLAEAGVHKRDFVSFLVNSTGLSKSGARRIIDDKRPPKRKEVFLKLVASITDEMNARKEGSVSTSEVIDYLLENKPIPALVTISEVNISGYLKQDAVRTSQIIIKIEDVARKNNISTSSDLNPKMVQLIQYRIISYCFKNDVNCEETKVTSMIESLFELAKQNLL